MKTDGPQKGKTRQVIALQSHDDVLYLFLQKQNRECCLLFMGIVSAPERVTTNASMPFAGARTRRSARSAEDQAPTSARS